VSPDQKQTENIAVVIRLNKRRSGIVLPDQKQTENAALVIRLTGDQVLCRQTRNRLKMLQW
jgi:hypothetical protein